MERRVPAGLTVVPGVSSRAEMTNSSGMKRDAKSKKGRLRSGDVRTTVGLPALERLAALDPVS